MFNPLSFVGFHTWLSLIAIVAGIPVAVGLLRGHVSPRWTGVFLSTAFATSATGFGFPISGLLPSHIIGAVALALVVVAGFALYARMLIGPWRGIYAITAMLSFYLLLFVLVAQAFQKVPALRALAPAGSVPPFALVEGVLLAVFVGLTWLAARRFTTYRPVS